MSAKSLGLTTICSTIFATQLGMIFLLDRLQYMDEIPTGAALLAQQVMLEFHLILWHFRFILETSI
jgi:hypothetical protein